MQIIRICNIINDSSGCLPVATTQLGSEFTPVTRDPVAPECRVNNVKHVFLRLLCYTSPRRISQLTQPRPRAVACALSGATRPYNSTGGPETGRAFHKHTNCLVLYFVVGGHNVSGEAPIPTHLGSDPARRWPWESRRLAFRATKER